MKFIGIIYFIGYLENILFYVESLGRIGKIVDKVFVVVDEFYCILDWGEDFRFDFRFICELRFYFFKGMKMFVIIVIVSKYL